MPDYKLQGNIIEPGSVITANTTYAKILDIKGMSGAFSLHIMSDQDLTINIQCSNLDNFFVEPNGWTAISHPAGEHFYELAFPICKKAKIHLKAGGSDTTVSAAMAGC